MAEEATEEGIRVGVFSGFHSEVQGRETRTHLLEICFNSRGGFIKITKFITNRRTTTLVIPEGDKSRGWETPRKMISSVLESLFGVIIVGQSDQVNTEEPMGDGSCKVKCSYVRVVEEEGPRRRALIPVEKWASTMICESRIGSLSERLLPES